MCVSFWATKLLKCQMRDPIFIIYYLFFFFFLNSIRFIKYHPIYHKIFVRTHSTAVYQLTREKSIVNCFSPQNICRQILATVVRYVPATFNSNVNPQLHKQHWCLYYFFFFLIQLKWSNL